MMFCTMVCGMLDLQTGECLYSNAGHNPPLVIRTGVDGHFRQKPEWLEMPEGMLMGINEAAVYQTRKIILNPGDMLLLYTDGVTEAMDKKEELYSEERLLGAVEKSEQNRPEDLIAAILKSVQEFAGEAPQSDDITCLAVKFNGTSAK
jgi:sigma-B regulation protein RsbU (phosphoserine phosphatase)